MPIVEQRLESGVFAILLHSPELTEQKIIFPRQPNGQPKSAEWLLKDRSFYHLLDAMLQVTHGDNIAFHLPSHGIGNHEKDLDQVERMIKNLTRILRELQESTESRNSLVSQTIIRALNSKGLTEE